MKPKPPSGSFTRRPRAPRRNMSREELRDQSRTASAAFQGELEQVRFSCTCGHTTTATMTPEGARTARVRCPICSGIMEPAP